MSDARLADRVREVARVSYSSVFAPSEHSFSGRGGMPSLVVPREGPAVEEFDLVAASHPLLKQIYANEELGVFVSANVGGGWRIQPEGVAAGIVGSAARRLVFTGGDVVDDEALATQAEMELQDFLALLRGDTVHCLALSAFGGITVDSGVRFDLPWGAARRSTDFESRITPFREVPASLVLEATVPVRFLVGEPGADPDPAPTALEQPARADALLPLAALLFGEREDYLVCEALWRTVLLPGSTGWSFTGVVRGSTWMDRFAQPEQLDDEERKELVRWAETVDENYNPSLDVAARRTLSAVRERIDDEDALIDAVVAMESLFGHGGETEVTFRVTSAISLLLEPDPSARAAFRSQLGRLYKSRSQVVHGGTPDAAKVHEHKEQALQTAVRCLQFLFRDQPQLIGVKDRGMRLILQDKS